MEINYLLILGLGVASMVIGGVWYGVLFGKRWERLQGIGDMPTKQAITLYGVQFVATLLMIFVVYVFTKPAADVMHEVSSALWLYAGIVLPVLISAVIWLNRSNKEKIELLLIQGGYMLVLFTLVGYAVHLWG